MPRVIFLMLLVLNVNSLASEHEISTPAEFLGFEVGADRKLADWKQISSYFTELEKGSDRILLQEIGKSTEGNPFLLAIVSSPQNLKNLSTYREIQSRLSDPRLVEDDLEDLVERGRTIVLTTCGIHSTEVASSQMSMEFAWKMATAEDQETQEILDNVIFLFVPSLNPDGVNIVTEWYRETLGTEAEGSIPPELYQKYVGHDNNRDWYMFTQKETRLVIGEIYDQWHPQIVYDIHQMGPNGARIFVPPYIDPYEQNVDPIIQAQIIDLGGFLFSSLVTSGRKGVVTHAIFDAYTPARAYPHYHGAVRILSESASARLATPIYIRADQLGQGQNYHGSKPSWNFPEPWEGGDWRVRDIVDDQMVALRATLLHASKNRKSWLKNFHAIGQRNLNRAEGPYAFVIPRKQRDLEALYTLLEVLDFGGLEINIAQDSFTLENPVCVSPPYCREGVVSFQPGAFLVYLSQPYGSFAKTMLEIQDYPAVLQYPNGPLKTPYDVTAHTLGIQLGAEVYQVAKPFQVPSRLAETIERPTGTVRGRGKYWLFSHNSTAFARLANRLLGKGYRVDWATYGFRVGGVSFPAGTLMARIGDPAESEIEEVLDGIPGEVTRVPKWPQLAWQKIGRPKIGLYQSFQSSMDEGWTRWVLEQNEFEYRTLQDQDLRLDAIQDLDVVVFPDQLPMEILEGLSIPYPERFRGGLGLEGLNSLKKFVDSGGTLLCLGASGGLFLDQWRLEGVREFKSQHSPLNIPGSLLKIQVNSRHPIGYGMAPESAAMFVNSPAYEVGDAIGIASYLDEEILLSGWAEGQSFLRGRHAVVEVPIGRGRLVLIGVRTQFRAQTRGTYKFLFNSLFYATVD